MDIREKVAMLSEEIREKSPLIHNITNYVTVNDCANAVLAIGASPIMADDIGEAADITAISSALVINIGTLNRHTIPSIFEAGKRANEIGIPVVFDPVGIGASRLRMNTSLKLLEDIKFAVIKGNATEIKAIISGNKTSSGVDVSIDDIISDSNLDDYIKIAKKVSKTYDSIVVITGPIDIITDGKKTYTISNGHVNMEKITGTGCMLAGLIGAFIASHATFSAEVFNLINNGRLGWALIVITSHLVGSLLMTYLGWLGFRLLNALA